MSDNKRNKIKLKLKNILSEIFKIDMEKLKVEDWDEKLLGKVMGFEPRDLVYLYIEIEKQFNIQIPDESIESGKFKTLNCIIDVILKET